MNERTCTRCNETKSSIHFSPSGRGGKYFASKCKPCNAEAAREYRLKNNEQVNKVAKRSRAKRSKANYRARKDYISKLKEKPCSDCKVQYPWYVMDFDHRPGETKEFTIGQSPNIAWDRILKEVAKCDVVCSNCHRERTYQRRQVD